MGNKDKTRDGDAATENRDSQANRDHSQPGKKLEMQH